MLRIIQAGMGGWGRDWAKNVLERDDSVALVACVDADQAALALARRQQMLTGDDLVEDDVEDRRIATTMEARQASLDETRELELLHDNPEGGS